MRLAGDTRISIATLRVPPGSVGCDLVSSSLTSSAAH
jgi:hypothetical protein